MWKSCQDATQFRFHELKSSLCLNLVPLLKLTFKENKCTAVTSLRVCKPAAGPAADERTSIPIYSKTPVIKSLRLQGF